MPETQAFSTDSGVWRAPSGTLGALVDAAFARAAIQSADTASWKSRALGAPPVPSLRAALLRDTVSVIAEIKRRSPSRGVIRDEITAGPRAAIYSEAGASAISVLTEPDRFGGSMEDLAQVVCAVPIPVIRKDFIVAPVQLYHARALGASAALLIARALSPDALRELHDAAAETGLEVLVEIRSEVELERAVGIGARIIGVNNRNLESLVVEKGTAERLVPLIPRDVAAVAESGMARREDVTEAARFGADAVLIGSAVSASDDASALVSAFTGVRVERNARPD